MTHLLGNSGRSASSPLHSSLARSNQYNVLLCISNMKVEGPFSPDIWLHSPVGSSAFQKIDKSTGHANVENVDTFCR
jgi:hypothetical protein